PTCAPLCRSRSPVSLPRARRRSIASTISTAATSASKRSSPPAAPRSSGSRGDAGAVMEGKLKLSALDPHDLSVTAAAVQDSLVAVRDCAFFAAENRFVLLLNRFRWEADATVETAYWRTHSALVFNAVRVVHHHKIPLQEPDRVLELLAVLQ